MVSDEFEFLEDIDVEHEYNTLYEWCKRKGSRGDQILAEWNYEKNITCYGMALEPYEFKRGSDKVVWWKCIRCGHEYKLPIRSRLNYVIGCEKCRTKGTSFSEMVVYYGIKYKFPEALSRCKCGDEKLEFDIVIPEINTYIEYSGEYWHETHSKSDIKKHIYCKEHNIRFIEVLEMKKSTPLKVIENKIIYKYSEHNQDDMLFHIIIELYKMLGVEDLELDYDEILRQAHKRILRPVENSLIRMYPMIGDEWDNEINNGAKAEYFTVSSAKRINWKCTKCENIWDCTIASRTEFKTGCPKCGFNIFDRKIHKNCIKRKPGLSLITFI